MIKHFDNETISQLLLRNIQQIIFTGILMRRCYHQQVMFYGRCHEDRLHGRRHQLVIQHILQPQA